LLLLLVLLVAGGVFWYRDHSVSSPTTDDNQAQSQAQTPPEPTGPDAELEAIFTNWAQAHPEHKWAMVVRGLDGDKRYASYRASEVYEAASIYKLFLTYLLFKEISLDQVGSITVSSQGRSWSLEYCLDVALRVSDNPCAWAIGNYTGWESSNPELEQAGFTQTALDITAGHRTSAEDTADLLEGMYKATLYTPEERDYLLNILRKQSHNQGIPAGCSGCTVANKTGELPVVKHDAAIVQHNSKSYLVVIFSDGATYSEIAELASQIHSRMSE
jgi:beta-lactamase class A